MKLLRGFGFLRGKMSETRFCQALPGSRIRRSLHANPPRFDEAKFSEKPLHFKKFKMKQAEMQKDDGLPVYLKKGAPDQFLFKLTFGLVLLGLLMSVKTLRDLDK